VLNRAEDELTRLTMPKVDQTPLSTKIRDHLVLDHFYLALRESQIQALRALKDLLKRTYYSTTTSGKERWTGIYIYSNIGTYFEAIPIEKVARLAFAFRTGPSHFVDCRKMCRELPHLPWQGGKKLWRQSKRTWFNWLNTELKVGFENSEIGAWMMHYPGLHESKLVAATERASIERFKSIEVVMSPKARGTLIELSRWMPGKIEIRARSASLALKDRDYGTFHVEIDFRKNQPEGATLKKLVAQTHDDLESFQVKAGEMKAFSLGGEFIIQAR
jgi:hypothetical protein